MNPVGGNKSPSAPAKSIDPKSADGISTAFEGETGKVEARQERHRRLPRRTPKQPARSKLFKLRKLVDVEGFRLAFTGELNRDDIHAIAPLLEDAKVAVQEEHVEGHPDQDQFLLLGSEDLVHAALRKIDKAITLLTLLGIDRHEACVLLAQPEMKAALADGSIRFRVADSGAPMLRGKKQDIARLQRTFRALVHCGHPGAAIRLLQAAPPSVRQKCLVFGDSLVDCGDGIGQYRAAFVEMMVPALASEAVDLANNDSDEAIGLLESANQLARAAASEMPDAQRIAVRNEVHAALKQLLAPPEGDGEFFEQVKGSLLRLVQTLHDPEDPRGSEGEVRARIDELRQRVAAGPQETASELIEELGQLELAYIMSVSDDLKKQFGDDLGLKEFGHLSVERARSFGAVKALVELAAFAISSPEPGIVAHGNMMLGTLHDLEWSGFTSEERKELEDAITSSVANLTQASKNSDPGAAEATQAGILAIVQLAFYPTGEDLSLDDLRAEIVRRRQMADHVPTQFDELARDQLAMLESEYQGATMQELTKKISILTRGAMAWRMDVNVGNLGAQTSDVELMEAAEAALSAAEFDIDSHEVDKVGNGRFTLGVVADFASRQAPSGEISALRDKVQRAQERGLAMQIARSANAGEREDVLKTLQAAEQANCSDEAASGACKVFLSTRHASGDAPAIWSHVALDYLNRVLPRLTSGQPALLAAAIVSTPGVRDALEVLARHNGEALKKLLMSHARTDAGDFRIAVVGAVLATAPALARDTLFPAVASIAGLDPLRVDASRFVDVAAEAIQHPNGVKNLAELIKTLESGIPVNDDKRWAMTQKRKSEVQEIVARFIGTSQPADEASAAGHAKLLQEAYAVCIANPSMHADFAEFKRDVRAQASPDRQAAIGFESDEANELAQRIATSAMDDDVAAALKALAGTTRSIGPGFWKILSRNDLESVAAAAMKAAALRGDTAAAAEIFVDLGKAEKMLGPAHARLALRAALLVMGDIRTNGPVPLFEFVSMLIRHGMSRDDLTNLGIPNLLNQSFDHVPIPRRGRRVFPSVETTFGKLLGAAREASFSRADQADLLTQSLDLAMVAYPRGVPHAPHVIEVLTPMLKEFSLDFNDPLRRSFTRGQSFTTGVTWRRVKFEVDKKRYG